MALASAEESGRRDVHSFSTPDAVCLAHIALDLTVSFERRILHGTAILQLVRHAPGPLVLDTRDLVIEGVTSDSQPVPYELGPRDPILGAPLLIDLPDGVMQIEIAYATIPEATGLQWLTPAQTAGGEHPFLYSQSQAIHARGWVPLQDSPGVRMTFEACIHTPVELRAVMGAEQAVDAALTGKFRFQTAKPIPSYLLSLAVGNLVFEATGPRTGVFAEPTLISPAAWEFGDAEQMIQATESLYGPYRWGRYDLLVLPPSFPFGGMENPYLTFVTPTVIAGDKSLAGLISHELAHSWSGNLVTNATWRDLWLNEGFTTYVENRIQAQVFGQAQADMEAVLAVAELQRELSLLPPPDQVLHIDLTGRDPDDGMTHVPYVKGALFLRLLEQEFGRARFDEFIRAYFDHFAFQSITTAQFVEYLQSTLLKAGHGRIDLHKWIEQPGLPDTSPAIHARAFDEVDQAARTWSPGNSPIAAQYRGWSTQQRQRFLQQLAKPLGPEKVAALDREFSLTATGDNEVLADWLQLAVQEGYELAYGRLAEFLTQVGRRKYLRPLYEELVKTAPGRERASRIFDRARTLYHPIAASSIEAIVQGE